MNLIPLGSPHTSYALIPSHLCWCFSGFPPACQWLSHVAESKPRHNISHVSVQGPKRGNNHFPQCTSYDIKAVCGCALIAAEAHCQLAFNLFSMRPSISCSTRLLSCQPALRLCFTWAYYASHSLYLAKISELCGSLFLQHVEIPLKNSPALCPASCSFLLGLNLVLAHSCQTPSHYLQENTSKQYWSQGKCHS